MSFLSAHNISDHKLPGKEAEWKADDEMTGSQYKLMRSQLIQVEEEIGDSINKTEANHDEIKSKVVETLKLFKNCTT